MVLELSTELGNRARERLSSESHESIIWLTTVAKDGSPFPKPVWFWWDGEAILVYSQPNALALKHLARSPRASVNFDVAAGAGPGRVIAMTGAAVCSDAAEDGHSAGFLAKYASELPALLAEYGEDFSALYTVLIRIVPDRIMGH